MKKEKCKRLFYLLTVIYSFNYIENSYAACTSSSNPLWTADYGSVCDYTTGSSETIKKIDANTGGIIKINASGLLTIDASSIIGVSPIYAYDSGSRIEIYGDIKTIGALGQEVGIRASGGGTLLIQGNVDNTSGRAGLNVETHGYITVNGNFTSKNYTSHGMYAKVGTIILNGNATLIALNSSGGSGIYTDDSGTITVNGDVNIESANLGVFSKSNSEISINGKLNVSLDKKSNVAAVYAVNSDSTVKINAGAVITTTQSTSDGLRSSGGKITGIDVDIETGGATAAGVSAITNASSNVATLISIENLSIKTKGNYSDGIQV